MKPKAASTRPKPCFDPNIGALTQIVEQYKPPDTPVAVTDVVTDIDTIVRDVSYTGWADQAGDRAVRKELRLVLSKYALPLTGNCSTPRTRTSGELLKGGPMDDATHEADGADRHPTGEPSEGDSRKGQPPRRSRVGSFRVGLMIHETSVMHPLLTVTLMSDGSVIVSPRAQSSAGWLVAISRCATAGVGFGKVPMMWDQSVRCPGPKARG